MPKTIIYGMAKLNDARYGYGSTSNKNYNSTYFLPSNFAFLKYLNNHHKIKSIEVAKRYKGSIKTSLVLKSKNIHYKIDKIPENKNLIKKYLKKEVDKYLELVNKKIEILYLHQKQLNIISNPVFLSWLKKKQKLKKIKYIGVSIYSLKELNYALKSSIIKVIQIPVNIADSYLYSKIPTKSKKIFVARSIYLQGSLINKITKHPKKNEIKKYIKKIKNVCKKNKIKYFKTVTSYPFNLKKINYVIVSSLSKNNLKEIFKSITYINKKKMKTFYNYSINYKSWANPKNWKRISSA